MIYFSPLLLQSQRKQEDVILRNVSFQRSSFREAVPRQSVAGSACGTSPCCHSLSILENEIRKLEPLGKVHTKNTCGLWHSGPWLIQERRLTQICASKCSSDLSTFFCKYLYYYIHIYVLFLFEAIHLHTKEIKIHKHKHLPTLVFQNQFKPILDSDFKTVSRRPQKWHPPAAGKNIVYATQRSLRLLKSTTYHNYDIRIGGITQKVAGHHEREPLTDL